MAYYVWNFTNLSSQGKPSCKITPMFGLHLKIMWQSYLRVTEQLKQKNQINHAKVNKGKKTSILDMPKTSSWKIKRSILRVSLYI